MIDAHIHLHQYDDGTLKDEIEKWQQCGLKGVIAVSDDLASSYQTLELSEAFPDFVYPCVGFHPERPFPNESDKEEWKSLIKYERNRIIAIGEIGLPHYELPTLPFILDEAIMQLEEYIDVAMIYDLPIILHAVHDKARIALDLLRKQKVKKAHFHWLKADSDTIHEIVSSGYYISVTPEVCYRERDRRLMEQVPLSKLLVETDGPWTFNGEFKGKKTTPSFLPSVIREVASIKNVIEKDAASQIYENTKACYELG